MEEQTKNKYVIGVIGALIGALIGAIPWVLMYIFANMMYALLSMLIVLCSYYGYKLTKAKIDKKLPVILAITSFISITVTMFIIIPVCLMLREGVPVSLENIQLLYQYDEFTGALMTDYMISLLFCALVIGGIIFNLNKQLKNGVSDKDIKLISQDAGTDAFPKEDIDKVKDIFEKNDAMSKNHTITKELIMEDIEKEFGEEKGKRIFNYLKVQQIIKKKSNKYYFSEKAQKNVFYRYGIASFKTFIIVLLLATVIACIIIFFEEKSKNDTLNQMLNTDSTDSVYETGSDGIDLEFPEGMIQISNEEIEYYFGEEYANIYDCMAVSEDFQKMIMVFTTYKANLDKEYTVEEFLKASMDDDSIEIEEKEISGNTFYVVNRPYETEDGIKYIEQDYVYDAEDRFICIIFDSLESDSLKPEEIIK